MGNKNWIIALENMISILKEENIERLIKLCDDNFMLEKVERRIITMNNEEI